MKEMRYKLEEMPIEKKNSKSFAQKYKTENKKKQKKYNQCFRKNVLQEQYTDYEEPVKKEEYCKNMNNRLASVTKENLSKTKKEKTGMPPVYKCAELLKKKCEFINYEDKLYYYNGKCYDLIGEKEVAKLYIGKIDKKIGGEKNMHILSHIYKYLCIDWDICVQEMKKNQRIAILNNGIFDVQHQILYSHKSSNIAFSYIDASYQKDIECKNFDQFIKKVTHGDTKLIERMWMFLGYILMQTTEAKVFFVMGEAPDSGKSLLGNFIESLFEKKYVSNIALNDFNKEFSLAPIVGSAVNISLDLPSSTLSANAVSKLKMLTGGDTVNINQKYVSEFKYKNRAKFIFATNKPIKIAQKDDAFWNRMIYIPFDKSIPKEKQKHDLMDKFKQEKDAIVSKALMYAKKLIDNDFQFPTTSTIEKKMSEWRGEEDKTIRLFLKECCEFDETSKGELVENLYNVYCEYCKEKYYITQKRYVFKRFLQEQVGLEHKKMRQGCVNPQSAFKGIKLKRGVLDEF